MRLHKRAQETVSIQVHAGEIFGIAGVDGNGQQELEEMIVGNRKTEEGTISMNGKEVQNLSVKERKARDMAISHLTVTKTLWFLIFLLQKTSC